MEIKHLYFSYKDQEVLKDISLKIKENKITTILGANGCGKSTLFNICTKFLKTRRGIIKISGKNIDDFGRREFAKKVAIVHQQNRSVPDITVEEMVFYGRTPYMKFLSKFNNEDYKAVEWAINTTGLSKLKNKKLNSLSGGQKQRVFIAMALAQKSEILFLDEPTTYLDVKYQIEILELIKKLNRDFNITIIMVLHDINQAIKYSDEIVGLYKGKVAFAGKPEDVINTQSISELYEASLEVEEFRGHKLVIV